MFQTRGVKVFGAALISILIGAVILRILGNNPPPAGAFSLSDYYSLEAVEEVICSYTSQPNRKWDGIAICYGNGTKNDIARVASANQRINFNNANYHFIVWNGIIGGDGQIQAMQKWQKQLPAVPCGTHNNNEHTIRIFVVTDETINSLTDFQITRVEALVEFLSRKFAIQPASIYYRDIW